MYQNFRQRNIPERQQCRCSNFKPNFDLDAARISQNSKHESCRALSWCSIESLIISIGDWMRELCPDYEAMSNLSRVAQLATFCTQRLRLHPKSKYKNDKYIYAPNQIHSREVSILLVLVLPLSSSSNNEQLHDQSKQ